MRPKPSVARERNGTDSGGNDDEGGDDVRDTVASGEIEGGVRLVESEVRSERHEEVSAGLRSDHGKAHHQGSANERDPSRSLPRSHPSPCGATPATLPHKTAPCAGVICNSTYE